MAEENGLVLIRSRYSVDETVRRLEAAFGEKGILQRSSVLGGAAWRAGGTDQESCGGVIGKAVE